MRSLGILVLAVTLLGCSTEAARERQKQARTLHEFRMFGTRVMEHKSSWQKAELGGQEAEPSGSPAVRRVELEALRELMPKASIEAMPVDGWDRPFEVWISGLAGSRRMMLRSGGRDGVFESEVPGEEWTMMRGGFPSGEADRDILWINGEFITWPVGR